MSVVPSAMSVLTMIETSGTCAAALVAQQLGPRLAEGLGEAGVVSAASMRSPGITTRRCSASARLQQRGDRGLVRPVAVETFDAGAQRRLQGNDFSHART